ncbi:MAG: acyltransferase [Candidatus Thorarchaeota archaeon]|nr:acyltransferase [Candidatus Thorarchaeota archaeon]
MAQNRVSWVDIAKALALILVIAVHSIPRNFYSSILTGFVMPAFFILYGVTHNADKHRENLTGYIYNRFRSLMIPYVILSFVMILMYTLLYPQIDFGFTPLDTLFWFFYGNGPMGRISHLWFLRTMFFAIILFSLVDKYLNNKPEILRFPLILGLPAIGVFLKTATGVELVPWGLDAVLISLSFIMIGNEIRKFAHTSPWTVDPIFDGITVFLSLIFFLLLSISNGFVNIGESLYGLSIYTYLLTGLLGTYCLGIISYHLSNRSSLLTKVAQRWNRFGQEIYELHPLIIEANYQFLGGLVVLNVITYYPGILLFLVNFFAAMVVTYFASSRIISKSSILRLAFLGWSSTKHVPTKIEEIPTQSILEERQEILEENAILE